jgi:general secretion pathway protein I
MRHTSVPAARGFTLIEVLAALAIVSLGLLAVIQAVGQTANNSAYLREKTIAHWVAMNRITEMRLDAANLTTGESTGEVQMAQRRWRWEARVTPTAVATMRRIDVDVSLLVEDEEPNRLITGTGFVGSKIAAPGQVIADWTAAPNVLGATPGGQNPGQNPQGPGPGPAPSPSPQPPGGGEQ